MGQGKSCAQMFDCFYDAICCVFGSKCVSANVYFCKIFDIYGSLNQWKGSDITHKMIEKLDWYFDDMSYVYAIVAVFDPRTKLDFVKYSFEQFNNGDTSEHGRLPNVDLALGNIFHLYTENPTSQRSSSSFITNDNSSSLDGDDPCNILDGWKKRKRSFITNDNSSSSDGDDPSNILDNWRKTKRQRTELEKYLQEPLQPDEEFDILGWWHTKSQDYPTLWMMAHDILAIPMSASTLNSAFCIETMTLDPIFNDLDPDIIEALFCGKDWLDNP